MSRIRSTARLLIDTIELRAGSIITSTEVRALKHRWSKRLYANQRMAKPIDIEKEIFGVFDEYGPFQIDKALTDSGLAWWKANLLRKDGTLRENVWIKDQGFNEDHVRIVHCFKHFTLDNWHVDYNGFGQPCASFPIFTMHGAGDSFTYIARPWQSGGRTELV